MKNQRKTQSTQPIKEKENPKKIKPFPELYEPEPIYCKKTPHFSVEQKRNEMAPEKRLKPTRAILLKEEEKAKREERSKKKQLLMLKENLRNSQEFLDWQNQQRKIDEDKKMQEVHDTKILLENERHLMQEAQEKRQSENQKLANEIKNDKRIENKRKIKETQKTQKKMQTLKIKVQKITENYLLAKEETFQNKRTQANQLKSEIEQMLDQKNNQEFKELNEKRMCVKKIRAYQEEIKKVTNLKNWERFAESHANIEMLSVSGLHLLYADLQKEFEDKMKVKRNKINDKKNLENENLQKIEEKMKKEKEKKNKLNELEKLEKERKLKIQSDQKNQECKQKETETLMKILKKKKEREIEAEETRELENEINQKKLFFNQQKERYEKIKNENIQIRKENVDRNGQTEKLFECYHLQDTKIKTLKNIDKVKTAEAELAWQKMKEYEREMNQGIKLREINKKVDMDYKKQQNKKIRDYTEEVRKLKLR